jgi:hypothetical protein
MDAPITLASAQRQRSLPVLSRRCPGKPRHHLELSAIGSTSRICGLSWHGRGSNASAVLCSCAECEVGKRTIAPVRRASSSFTTKLAWNKKAPFSCPGYPITTARRRKKARLQSRSRHVQVHDYCARNLGPGELRRLMTRAACRHRSTRNRRCSSIAQPSLVWICILWGGRFVPEPLIRSRIRLPPNLRLEGP